jgi:peptide/nickel transport system permease protein
MTTYIIKRLLLMIPTFFLISLIIFVVLNLAPGDPAAAQAATDGAESVSADARESYRIFKEQFNLDKPVILNTRYALKTESVRDQIRIVADFRRPVCPEDSPPTPQCTPLSERPGSADIIDAQEILEDWGNYAVPQLYGIATDEAERLDIRIAAANQMGSNAQRRLLPRHRKDSPEIRTQNQVIAAENNQLRRWRLPSDASAEALTEHLDKTWNPWYEEHRARFEYTGAEKVSILFTDTRFYRYWANLVRLDFGVSTVDRRPVMQTLWSKLPYTLTLSFLSILFAYMISIPLGIWSAYNRNTKKDQAVTIFLFVLYSLPSFFTAVLLIRFFAIDRPFKWFPAGGFVGTGHEQMAVLEYIQSVSWHLVLPVICLTYGGLAALSRYARTGLLDVIRADYIRTARAKGLSESMVVLKHAVRNGMIPILTLIGTLLPALVSGSIVIEFIFNIPGIGLYLFESINNFDYNAIMAALLMSSALTLIGLLISDISYAIVDPRISFD